MSGSADRWIRRTTTGCVAMLALIAATVSYLHMHMLVELDGQPGWVAALTPFSVGGMIVAASTTLLADSRAGERGGVLPWALLVAGSLASLAANVAVAQPTLVGRVIAAWPSFALIGAYEMLMRQVRRSAVTTAKPAPRESVPHASSREAGGGSVGRSRAHAPGSRASASKTSPALVVRAASFSGRRGGGLWRTGRRMDRFQAAVRSPASTGGMNGGVGWSSAQEPQAS